MGYLQMDDENMIRMQIGERIRKKRQELDLTQAAFSQLLDISPSYLSAIERGQRGISSRISRSIHELTGMSFDYLLNGTSILDVSHAEYVRESDGTAEALYRRIEIMLQTCSQAELAVCYEMCHSFLSHSRKQH